MRQVQSFWRDDCGAVISAELALLGALVAVGGMLGLHHVSAVINDELHDVAQAIRGLDQGYAIAGFPGARAWTAGSSFRPEPAARLRVGSDEPISILCALAGDGEPIEDPPHDVPVTPAEEKLQPMPEQSGRKPFLH